MKPEPQPPMDMFDWNEWRQEEEQKRRSGAAQGSETVVLLEATAWYRPSTELAWIEGYLCQRWYPTSRHTIHHHPEWVVIPEMDKYSQPLEPENRKSPNAKLTR